MFIFLPAASCVNLGQFLGGLLGGYCGGRWFSHNISYLIWHIANLKWSEPILTQVWPKTHNSIVLRSSHLCLACHSICSKVRDGSRYQIGWIFGKVRESFSIQKSILQILDLIKGFFSDVFWKSCYIIFRKWGGWGSKAVWNFSENLSHLVAWPVPKSSYLLALSDMFFIYAIYSASIITTTSLPLLIVGRVLAGVCSSVNTANCSMLVAQVTPWYLWSYGCRCNW